MTLEPIFETTLRTIAAASLAGLGLGLFRVRSSTVKLAVWRLVLYASLLMPLAGLLPKRVVAPPPPAPVARVIHRAATTFGPAPAATASASRSTPIDWPAMAFRLYALAAGLLLLRAALGLLRLRRFSLNAAPVPDLGPEVFESASLAVPVTCGVPHPRILLPVDWRSWTAETLDAVLVHERAHIAERDFLTQCLSKVNRAIYWANPLAWWLDRQLAALAEHSSDDAALSRVGERPAYAAMLLGFAGREVGLASAAGVSMARRAGVSSRIERILDEARMLSRPVSKANRIALAAAMLVAVLAIGASQLPAVASAQEVAAPTTSLPKGTYTSDHWWWSDRNRQEYVLVTSHGTTMNGSSSSEARAKSMAARTHGDYLWFTRDGKEYLIDDPKTLAEIESWFAPMDELGRQQGELGKQQSVLGEQMSKLGEEMSKLGDQMSRVRVEIHPEELAKLKAELAELQKLRLTGVSGGVSADELSDLQNRLGEAQALLGAAQSRAGDKQEQIGELQSKLGEQQALLGEKQGKLGEEQGRLGEQQGKIAEEAEKKLRRLFDQVIGDGRAKPVR